MIAILDYGSGNIRSAQRALEKTKHKVEITQDFEVAVAADGLVVPGVGAFGACMQGLLKVKGDVIIRERLANQKKIFGICVGMQILFSDSAELYHGERVKGVGVFAQSVERLSSKVLPHIGWNSVKIDQESKSFAGIEQESFYFVHSYAVIAPIPGVINIRTNYEGDFVSAIESDLITATQFHPEKSGAAGLKLISNWANSL